MDSRAETDASRSNENVGLLTSSPGNGKRDQQPASAASTPTFNKNKLFGSLTNQSSKSDTNQAQSSALALTNSVSKLNTISETDVSATNLLLKPADLLIPRKAPTLPSLNEAATVRQKWVILLSKAKGGVYNIPKAFVNHETDSNLLRRSPSTLSMIKQVEAEAEANQPDAQPQQASKLQLKVPSNLLAPTIYKSTSNYTEKISLRSTNKLNESATLGNFQNLDESGGFQLDIDNLEFESTIKTSRNDDGFNRNPQKLLSTLIECRQDLKTEIEKFNSKITKIDKKIIEILQILATTNQLEASMRSEIKKTNQFLDINNNTGRNSRMTTNDSIYSFGMHGNVSNMVQTSSQNSNLKSLNVTSPSVSVIGSKSNLKLRPTSSMMLDNTNNDDKQNTLPESKTTSQLASHQATLTQPTITVNEVKASKSSKQPKESHKRDNIAGSNSSSIASAVAGASSILSLSSGKQFPSSVTAITSIAASSSTAGVSAVAASSSSAAAPITTSNYNVNLIPIETEQKYNLTSSASDNLIKDTPYMRKLNDNKKFSKGKLISEYEDDKSFDLKVISKKRDKDYKA